MLIASESLVYPSMRKGRFGRGIPKDYLSSLNHLAPSPV